jgi:DNA-binding CsgD family transcriptional regulator
VVWPVTAATRFFADVGAVRTPDQMLDLLHWRATDAGLLLYGFWRLPQRRYDFAKYVLGRDTFIHENVPTGHTTELFAIARERGPSALSRRAWRNMGPFTFQEAINDAPLESGDRWIVDLNEKYGVRDGLYCPSPFLWMVCFWSSARLQLTEEQRALFVFMAQRAALALQKIVPPPTIDRPALSPRQIEMLRAMSEGWLDREIAEHLGISEGTVRTHIERAMKTLQVKTRPQAVREAMHWMHIP